MEKISIEELIKLAKDYSAINTPWHHHFLTPKCLFNKTNKYLIVLEKEDSQESFQAEFNENPMEELEKIENIFFKRN